MSTGETRPSALAILSRHWRRALTAVIALAAVIALVVLHAPIIAWFTGAPMGGGGGEGVEAEAGAFRLVAALDPDPPRQRGNRIRLDVRDAGGATVEDARVSVRYVMPAMGAMSEMRGDAAVEETGDGVYVASFDLPAQGSWTLEVEVEEGDRAGSAIFSLTVGTRGLHAGGGDDASDTEAEPEPPALPPHALPEPALAALRGAFHAYDEARALLARDEVLGIDAPAHAAASALRAASSALHDAPAEVTGCLADAIEKAEALGRVGDLGDARRRFGELSALLVALGASDPRLAEGFHLFHCPMAEGEGRWFQRSAELENPYMGRRMLTCGSRAEWTRGPGEEAHEHQAGDDVVAYYTCSMHPSVREADPGQCPLCNMQLTPVTRGDVRTGIVRVDEATRRRIGVRIGEVARAPLELRIRAVGLVRYDETRVTDVTPRVSGYITRLYVETTGQPVRRGQRLFTLYSPEVYAAELEYLQTLERASAPTGARLAAVARRRLELWGITAAQIRRIEERRQASDTIDFVSPATGYVIEKDVVEGAAIEAGRRLYRIAALDRVWIEAEVYESDLPHVRAGQAASVTLPYAAGRRYEGSVAYVYPYVESETRTGRVRIELANTDLELRVDMYANVEIAVDLGERLLVPEPAVIYTGPRRLVFVDLGEDRLAPREIRVGVRAAGSYEVLEGLREGDRIVISGNFLIAAESRVRTASELWRSDDGE